MVTIRVPRGGGIAVIQCIGSALEAGMCFIVKPQVVPDKGPTAQIGDTVVVTRSGGQRLGERALSLRVID